VLTAAGKVIGDSEFPADAAGYAQSAGLTAEEVGTALLRCRFRYRFGYRRHPGLPSQHSL
jgi:hypothetical protein